LSVINEIKEEGTKIKAMVDRHIEKMITTLREKARHEKESLTKTLVDYKQQLDKFFTSQFYFRDDIFTALKLVIFCSFHPLM
jgi:hypothetical protein